MFYVAVNPLHHEEEKERIIILLEFSVGGLVPNDLSGQQRQSSSHPFLKVLLWYAALRRAKLVVGILQRAQRLRIISVFIDPTLSTLLSFLLILFLLGFAVLFSPAVVSILYRFVAILI
jgi:hypothetical protein